MPPSTSATKPTTAAIKQPPVVVAVPIEERWKIADQKEAYELAKLETSNKKVAKPTMEDRFRLADEKEAKKRGKRGSLENKLNSAIGKAARTAAKYAKLAQEKLAKHGTSKEEEQPAPAPAPAPTTTIVNLTEDDILTEEEN